MKINIEIDGGSAVSSTASSPQDNNGQNQINAGAFANFVADSSGDHSTAYQSSNSLDAGKPSDAVFEWKASIGQDNDPQESQPSNRDGSIDVGTAPNL